LRDKIWIDETYVPDSSSLRGQTGNRSGAFQKSRSA
jgi:hypothetical protein